MAVEFNDEHKASVLYSRIQASDRVPTLVQWVMKTGLAKTPERANIILIGIIVIVLIAAGVIFYNQNNGGKLSPEQQAAREAVMKQMNIDLQR